ncbi:aminotransferase class I/II-fold pyridoxal phosphate-dependent enzyme [Nonomuraea sp. NN258]|uniref:aminotransferase class I/II-fold pyridoxal phosphate-dependent enzyme n=1 Tax=Nonomuraea antri TaxID=2730852 RepID=UPI001568519C|nr:aminotransferase class I/II-fold pyridoxal phosphate-dependent enzyme [Nonomuraea antri]NRQ37366.1 aminotransferase class I/II-fold pyridoxal phosphate-dependent enzyme [Nonomuraea antri]
MSLDLTGRFPLWPGEPLRLWRAAAQRALRDVDPSMRAPLAGDGLLRDALGGHLGVDAARLTITSGVRSAAGPLMRSCAEVAVETPTFLGVPAALRAWGVAVRQAPWEELTGSSGLWFTAGCRNPDGRRPDQELLAAWAALAERGHRVVADTAYAWFAGPLSLPSGIVQVGTLHKLCGPGARLGWLVGPGPQEHDLLAALAPAAPTLHWQRTWGYFIDAGGLATFTARVPAVAAARRVFLTALTDESTPLTGTGPNVLVALAGDETRAVAALRAAGLLVSPGSAFGAAHPSLRVCLDGVPESDARAAATLIRSTIDVLGGT